MSGEFDGIALGSDQSRPVMTRPPALVASMKFVREVRDALHLPDDAAQDAADWVLNKMERFGAATAQPVFTLGEDAGAPLCSWCGAIWPLCGHQHMSEALDDE